MVQRALRAAATLPVIFCAGAGLAEPRRAPVDLRIVDKLCKLIVEGRPRMRTYIEAVGGKLVAESDAIATGELSTPTFRMMAVQGGKIVLQPNVDLDTLTPTLGQVHAKWPKEKFDPADKPDEAGLVHVVIARPGGKARCQVKMEFLTGVSDKSLEDASLTMVVVSR